MKKLLVGLLVILSLTFYFTVKVSAQSAPKEEKLEGVVAKILEDKKIEIFPGKKQPYQKVEVTITDGSLKEKKIVAELGKIAVSNDAQKLKTGDKVIVSYIKNVDGKDIFYIEDFNRRNPVYLLAGAFFIAVVIIGGLRGLSSFIGLIISFVVLLKYIIPQIINGGNPVLIAITGSFVILLTTLYLAHGISKKTTAAVLGTTISLVITGLLAAFSVGFARLSGFVSEQAAFVNAFPGADINLQGILLAGIIIGSLGVLDDITVSQSAVVFELKDANKKLSFEELYNRGLKVGRDHIASLVNTLVLAYAGASLPLFLLFTLNGGEPFNILINRELIASEVVRTLVGSLGLVMAVPITTVIAAIFCKYKK